jgi:hypothetical protein
MGKGLNEITRGVYIFNFLQILQNFDSANQRYSLSHAAIFGWHFRRSLRDKSTYNSDFL